MYKLSLSILLLSATFAQAQDKHTLDSVDKLIIAQFITPAEEKSPDQEPAWGALRIRILASYSDTQADRAITKGQIYFYYGRDWAKFSTAIVHYTDAYENKDDARLMNKNADFILQHSQNPKEWKAAQGWVKHILDKDPSNTACKTTYDALTSKINGQ